MPNGEKIIEMEDFRKQIERLSTKPEELERYLKETIPLLRGPIITDFSPRKGHPGSVVTIRGRNFSEKREENKVTVGGDHAIVLQAERDQLKVITGRLTTTGPIEVTSHFQKGKVARSEKEFLVLPYPRPGSEEDGPPVFYAGEGDGHAGDVPSTGTLNVLVVLVNPTDRVPTNPATARTTVRDRWQNVHTFYDQASYGRLNVTVDVTTNWHTLSGSTNDYVSTNPADNFAPNIRPNMRDRLMAEAAQAAVNEGKTLNQFQVMACVINLDGTFIRAWGGWDQSNFSYNNGAGININITTTHPINLIAIQESANWGRCAHELGHNIVSVPTQLSASPGSATLREDVYESDLFDPSIATAEMFEMMGAHDTHPLFSAYNMERMGYYSSSNILTLQWSRNPQRYEHEVVAHGLTENSVGARYHLIKIRVTQGLYYYIEVRQRPDTTAQLFDETIPLHSAPQQGGVVVTKVITDTMNMNQQMRFITLLHDPHVLKQGDVAIDPARALKITVSNDHVVNRPLVCRVVIEWAQGIPTDPNGAFNLWLQEWDGNYQTPDIWVDRLPYGTYDQALDSAGRPLLNGDRPRPNEINKFWARIHNAGSIDATDVQVTFYTVEPPGVGDNGNWAPLQTKSISVGANSHTDVSVDWVPVIGRHTCLKVWASQQWGETSGGDNWAQENVFQFEAPAHSVPAPVVTPIAIRNPLKSRTLVYITPKGVPQGFTVHIPHSWIWLDALGERTLELAVIPTYDYERYFKDIQRANVRVSGYIPRSYQEKLAPDTLPGSRMITIGGITAEVTPKRGVEIELWEDKEISHAEKKVVAVAGTIRPSSPAKVRIDLTDPNDQLHTLEAVSTDSRFHAAFDISNKYQPGEYRVQALIVNSPKTAQAESNIVSIMKE